MQIATLNLIPIPDSVMKFLTFGLNAEDEEEFALDEEYQMLEYENCLFLA